ncbi:PDGLE domain-containing protein [Halococcus sp. IIIV-5B]|uniref:PDGLE domain-containing protein n=1 Tax=Halococcus sp. IIIV-5B TaxID=2321230 RepID=UPI000E76B997|nr:PDGLE domain-containing protein [Halococcus sp. IIIV-5B]RJT07456.1 metal transporter [Halococcus sp. IIIV-5B]
MNSVWTNSWIRRACLAILLLVVLAPVFGWASGAVGYAEPVENAAEATGAAAAATTIHSGIFPDYSVPVLSTPLGTLTSALVGAALTLAVSVGIGRLLER